MNDRPDFDPGETLLEVRRFGGGLLRFARHLFTPPDGGEPRPWFELSAKKEGSAPRKMISLKTRELRALGQALIDAADKLEAEGHELAPPAPRPARQAGPDGGPRPAQHRTESAQRYLPGHRRPLGGGHD